MKDIEKLLSLLKKDANAFEFSNMIFDEKDSASYLFEVYGHDFHLSIKSNEFEILYALSYDADCASYEVNFQNEEDIFLEENLFNYEILFAKICLVIKTNPLGILTRFIELGK